MSGKKADFAYTQPFMVPGPLINNMCGGGIIKSLFQIKKPNDGKIWEEEVGNDNESKSTAASEFE